MCIGEYTQFTHRVPTELASGRCATSALPRQESRNALWQDTLIMKIIFDTCAIILIVD
jgi:hypothetical protein